MKDHEIAQIVNQLRDVAKEYGQTQQLRERIAGVVVPLLSASKPDTEPTWRCFHCDEAFTDAESAALHFGKSERQNPICSVDAAEYREMEERVRRCNEEDSDVHREMYGMVSRHQQALRREEEKGYASGLSDGRSIGIVEGWRLVPIEPTEDMVVSGFESRPDRLFSKPEDWAAFEAMSGCQQAAHKARLCYAAMIEAAPTGDKA